MYPYKQGIFKPEAPQKYVGSLPIVYRSGLELKFDRWCDRNGKVLQWGSESTIVPYTSPLDGRTHRYYVDYVLVLKTDKGIVKYIVEVKPSGQTQPPTNNGNKKKSTILYEQIQWAKNTCKWAAAREYANKKGWNFIIITEKDLN